MSGKSEGKIFLESLSEIEIKAIAEIIKIENNSKRLNQNSCVETEKKIKETIEKYSEDWGKNDI
ncbi:MAG: hypothetical protein ACRCYT_04945 [Cetobacterium sp.]